MLVNEKPADRVGGTAAATWRSAAPIASRSRGAPPAGGPTRAP